MYHVSPSRRADLPLAEEELDVDLQQAVRRISWIRQGFYVVVLLVALAGQVSGAVEALHIQLVWAIPAVAALELGGIVVLANADVRRRLGERAIASRLLSAAIAAGAVAFNWLAHANHLLGGFFAGMSALGYLVWLMHTENQRRDRLRAKGNLPPTSPAYELFAHCIRHPWLTMRAKGLAKAHPGLGLYESLAAAKAEINWERRHSAISKVLHRKIRSAVDPATADIAVAVYDLEEIASRLTSNADYEGLTALIAADLAPARLGVDTGLAPAPPRPALPAAGPADAARGHVDAAKELDVEQAVSKPRIQATVGPVEEPAPALMPPSLRGEVEALMSPRTRQSNGRQPAADAVRGDADRPAESGDRMAESRDQPAESGDRVAESTVDSAPAVDVDTVPAKEPALPLELERPAGRPADRLTPSPVRPRIRRDPSLRSRVHATLDAQVPAGDLRDEAELLDLVAQALELNEIDKLTATSYVQSWRRDVAAGRGTAALGSRNLHAFLPSA